VSFRCRLTHVHPNLRASSAVAHPPLITEVGQIPIDPEAAKFFFFTSSGPSTNESQRHVVARSARHIRGVDAVRASDADDWFQSDVFAPLDL
jgi:hypothetical protein